MKERTRSLSIMYFAQRRLSSGLLLQDLLTLEILSTPRLRSIIGLMKTGMLFKFFCISYNNIIYLDSGTKSQRTMKLKELKSICYKDSY